MKRFLLAAVFSLVAGAALAGDAHMRVILDDGANLALPNAALGTGPNPVVVYQSVYEALQAPVQASSGNVANATAAATLAAQSGKTNYLTGIEITGAGATASSVVAATVTGLLGGTRTLIVAVPAGVTTGIAPIVEQFNKALKGAAANTAITLTLPALGAGNTNAAVSLQGFYQ